MAASRAPARRRWRARLKQDRGAAAISEVVVVFPVLMLIVLVIAQFAVWAQATRTAQSAATHGLAAARADGATAADGRAQASAVLDQLGRGPLRGATVDASRGAERTEVRVEGTALPVVPFLHLPVHAEAAGPTEQFRPADEEPSP